MDNSSAKIVFKSDILDFKSKVNGECQENNVYLVLTFSGVIGLLIGLLVVVIFRYSNLFYFIYFK